MKYLLDTHVFIWWMEKNNRLKKEIKTILNNTENQIYLSVATILEIVIKKKIGKLKVPRSWKEDIRESSFLILPISLENAFQFELLPLIHNDPFDHILIAQSLSENLTLITSDEKIFKYKGDFIKA